MLKKFTARLKISGKSVKTFSFFSLSPDQDQDVPGRKKFHISKLLFELVQMMGIKPSF